MFWLTMVQYHGTDLGHFTTVLVHVPDENGEHGGPSLRGLSSAASWPLELRDINYESHTPLVYFNIILYGYTSVKVEPLSKESTTTP